MMQIIYPGSAQVKQNRLFTTIRRSYVTYQTVRFTEVTEKLLFESYRGKESNIDCRFLLTSNILKITYNLITD